MNHSIENNDDNLQPIRENRMLENARKYLESGLSVLPANKRQKRPTVGSWKEYQERLPRENELNEWFSRPQTGLCVIAGKVSGNLEIIDFDNGGELFEAWSKLIAPELFDRLVVQQTQSGGFHVVYRCKCEVNGNMKLAQRKDDSGKLQTLIETRGEGGLFLCDPTDGYHFTQNDFSSIPVLTSSERLSLLEAAWSLNDITPEGVNIAYPKIERRYDGNRPGDEYNQRGNVRELLTAHGWQYINEFDDNERWMRPGKKQGWSATLRKSDRVLYVFSSNAAPFDSNKAYYPFAVYTILQCNGDFSEATKRLADEGYGEKLKIEAVDDFDVDLSGIIGKKESVIDDPGPLGVKSDSQKRS